MCQKVREAAENLLFTNIREISENDMTEINFVITKAILAHLVKDIDDGDYYEYVHEMQLWVHTVNSDELFFDALVSFRNLWNIS